MYFKKLFRYKYFVIASVLMTSLIIASSLFQPLLLKQVLVSLQEKEHHEIYRIGAWLIGFSLVGLVAGGINVTLAAYIAQSLSSDLREDTFRKIQTFSYANIEQFNSGNLVVRMTNDINQIQNLTMLLFQVILRLPILLIGAIILAIVTLPVLWWLILLVLVLIGGLMAFIMRILSPRFEIFQVLIEKINAVAKENLRGIRVVKSFVQEEAEYQKFTTVSNQLLDQNLFIGYTFSILEPLMMFIGYGAICFTIWFLSGMIQSDSSVVSSIASFVAYLIQIIFTIIMIGFFGNTVTRAMISIRRLNEILATEPTMTFKEGTVEDLTGTISFEQVTFTYPLDNEPILKDITFDVQAGEMIGIVGATGSGKSTLAQLIPRLFDPQKGKILIGGKDLRDLSQESLRKNISIVLQKAILFSGTIAENLGQGKKQQSFSDIERASQMAQASEFINRMENGYDSLVEERGNNFSGGQKQRLSIARGLVNKPTILILDDSTSALDARSEKLVQEALSKDLKGTTTIMIAQKISSVIHADKILVMDQGQLVGQGTHSELLATNAIYREIYNTQKGKEE